jgi:hypothetical protein
MGECVIAKCLHKIIKDLLLGPGIFSALKMCTKCMKYSLLF